MTASTTATTGVAVVTVTGTSGNLTQTVAVNVRVAVPPSYTLSVAPNTLSIAQGSQTTSSITITPLNGFNGSVTFSASGLPTGVTATFSPNPGTGSSTLTFMASATAMTGVATVTITGTSGGLTQTVPINLTVNAVPNYTLSAVPGTLSIAQGSQDTSTITVNPANGFTGSVSLAAAGLPSGVTATFSSNPTTTSSSP